MTHCPFCGETKLSPIITLGSTAMSCDNCGATGPRVPTKLIGEKIDPTERLAAWEKRFSPKARFLVKQMVGTVHQKWLETIYKTEFERMALIEYDSYVKNNPDRYFELVKVESNESIVRFTPPKGENDAQK